MCPWVSHRVTKGETCRDMLLSCLIGHVYMFVVFLACKYVHIYVFQLLVFIMSLLLCGWTICFVVCCFGMELSCFPVFLFCWNAVGVCRSHRFRVRLVIAILLILRRMSPRFLSSVSLISGDLLVSRQLHTPPRSPPTCVRKSAGPQQIRPSEIYKNLGPDPGNTQKLPSLLWRRSSSCDLLQDRSDRFLTKQGREASSHLTASPIASCSAIWG